MIASPAQGLMLVLLLLTVISEAGTSCELVRHNNGVEDLPTTSTVQTISLVQRTAMTSLTLDKFSASTDAIANATEISFQRPKESPLQLFLAKYPAWLVGVAVLGVLSCFVTALMSLTWMLDAFEASRWSSGHVGRPWYMDDGMTMKVGSGALAIWLAVGMFQFTQLVHFKTKDDDVRTLTAIEAIYLCAQIVTTVGYGDLTPVDPAGQVLVASFILLGVVLVGVVFTEMLKALMRKGERAVVHCLVHSSDSAKQDGAGDASTNPRMSASLAADEALLEEKIAMEMESDDVMEQRRVMMEFLLSMGPFAVCLLIGTLFFHNYPGEDKSIWQAFYMSCVTLTSVGFGAVTPTTQGGQLFAAVWMLVGVGATAHMIISFGNWFLKRHREIQVGQLHMELLNEMDLDGNNSVDKCEFLRFELIRTGLCQKEDIDAILYRFQKLDVDKSGEIDIEDLKKLRGGVTTAALSSFTDSRQTRAVASSTVAANAG